MTKFWTKLIKNEKKNTLVKKNREKLTEKKKQTQEKKTIHESKLNCICTLLL